MRKWRRVACHAARLSLLGVALGSLGCAAAPLVPEPAAPPFPTSAQAGDTTIVAVAPASSGCNCTLPQFLGFQRGFQVLGGIADRIRNRLGMRFPGLEAKPPLLAISDPANLSEDASPAVQAAAEAKMEADKSAQKVKAIRYLASLGCGECYPDTEEALLAALEDCAEEVRYAAAAGLRKQADCGCGTCCRDSCCTPKLIEKLHEIAYGKDELGCCLEPSARVRRQARLAIRGCGSGVPSMPADDEITPEEGPTAEEMAESVLTNPDPTQVARLGDEAPTHGPQTAEAQAAEAAGESPQPSAPIATPSLVQPASAEVSAQAGNVSASANDGAPRQAP